MFDYDKKRERTSNTRQYDKYLGATLPRTNQIASCFDALSITYLNLCNALHVKNLFNLLRTFLLCVSITAFDFIHFLTNWFSNELIF
jgi:hypothetical protein